MIYYWASIKYKYWKKSKMFYPLKARSPKQRKLCLLTESVHLVNFTLHEINYKHNLFLKHCLYANIKTPLLQIFLIREVINYFFNRFFLLVFCCAHILYSIYRILPRILRCTVNLFTWITPTYGCFVKSPYDCQPLQFYGHYFTAVRTSN